MDRASKILNKVKEGSGDSIDVVVWDLLHVRGSASLSICQFYIESDAKKAFSVLSKLP